MLLVEYTHKPLRITESQNRWGLEIIKSNPPAETGLLHTVGHTGEHMENSKK